jgi:hypothetical protein
MGAGGVPLRSARCTAAAARTAEWTLTGSCDIRSGISAQRRVNERRLRISRSDRLAMAARLRLRSAMGGKKARRYCNSREVK